MIIVIAGEKYMWVHFPILSTLTSGIKIFHNKNKLKENKEGKGKEGRRGRRRKETRKGNYSSPY